ncbi:MAG: transglycosylase SLT domain-containing protein [Tannerella sp.]|jgi:membrane-bound lytic murein transglycosylase F|nr:transglycosylase SLT domain-containing protein [Tannerella sp.]
MLNNVNSRLIAVAVFFSMLSCTHRQKEKVPVVDLPQIREKGELTAVTLNSSISYFIYKGQKMGYEYDLIEDFATSQGLKLNVKVAENITRLEEMLQSGEADIVAFPVQMDNSMKQKVLFCGAEQQNHLVIVQRANREDKIVNDVTGLVGKEIWVKNNSRYHERLSSLNTELGGGIIVKNIALDTVTTEDLIDMVSSGKIRYTVSENNLASLNKTYHNNIDIHLQISFPQRASWVVRKECPQLASAVNVWASNLSIKSTMRAAVKRYFEQSKNEAADDEMPVIKKGDLSPYDDLFRKYAAQIKWDWQILASIAYQESKFKNHLESWAGAKGLMGIMPRTARNFGFSSGNLDDPEMSIRICAKIIQYLEKIFSDIEDRNEKEKFVLAAYNAGNGHIVDARKLAAKYGADPNVWAGNVAEYVRLKSEAEYYNDEVCKNGYLRGMETYKYVTEVMERYKTYKNSAKSP